MCYATDVLRTMYTMLFLIQQNNRLCFFDQETTLKIEQRYREKTKACGNKKSDLVAIRTQDLLLRRQLLYPAELRDQRNNQNILCVCRDSRIRTCDLLLPKQAR